jgi:hypothetical protein
MLVVKVARHCCKPLIIVFTLCRRFSIVVANNHYAGFGPGTVNIFRQLLGLEEVKWGEEFVTTDNLEKDDSNMNKRVIRTKQTSLSDLTQ